MRAAYRSAPAGFVALNAWSRRWWALWLWSVAHGELTAPMVHAASRGAPWRVAPERVPSDVGLIDIQVNSRAFAAWAEHFQRRGVRLPRPSRCPVVFLPAQAPPP